MKAWKEKASRTLPHPPHHHHSISRDGKLKTENCDQSLASLLASLTDRAQAGEPIDIDEVCGAHPEWAEELRVLWGTVLIAEAAASSAETLAPPGMPGQQLALPCRFGDYELLNELGRGGMGIVYRARQLSLHREVAIKLILQGPFATADERERFFAEAEAAARLDHPGIVPVYQVGDSEGQPFFSMKLVEGETLADRLARATLSPREAAGLVAALARAVDFAHRRGVLHRDLKPSNIMLDGSGRPHITDFGLAKLVTEASRTRSGAVLGTPSYMSPEQAAAGKTRLAPTSDVYSLGAILYHILTGQPPFQAPSPVDVMLMLREQDVVPPRVLNAQVPRDLEMIALRCLQKPTDLRYPSAAALADDLEAFLKDEPIAARSGRFPQVLSRLFRETHHATVLENWGLLWMWHSFVLLVICLLTSSLHWLGYEQRTYYVLLWTLGLGTWAAVFWGLRHRMGPVTFVERQIAHVWAGSMAASAALYWIEMLLDLPVLQLSPVLALIAGMVFMVKAGILSGSFYLQSAALFATAGAMAYAPHYAHAVFGIVAAACFFLPGFKYHRQRRGSLDAAA